jgi:hypothetical protein
LQTDTNQEFSYSSVLKFLKNADSDFLLAPNPLFLNKEKCLQIISEMYVSELHFLDISGKLNLVQKVDHTQTICMQHNLPKGVYTVRVYGKEKVEIKTTRLLVAD